MKKSDLSRLRKQLEQELDKLSKDISAKPMENPSQSALPDVNDQASFETERNFELRIRDRERKLVGKVQKALQKIEDGTYGICDSCGGEIGIKRLEARPVTNLCISCKSEIEAEERRQETMMQNAGRISQRGSTTFSV